MVVIRILSAIFFIVALGLAVMLVVNINKKIEDDKYLARQESMVINKLKMIRDAQVAYLAANGKYTGSFDSLLNFIETGTLYITQTTETVEQLGYGEEKVTQVKDTVGTVNVKDSLFVIREPLLCLGNGTIKEIAVKEGSTVEENDVIAKVVTSKGKSVNIKATKSGKIETIAVKVGDEVTAQQIFANLAYPRINDLKNLPFIPDSKNNAKFELFAGKIVKGIYTVDVFEAKDTQPVNPARRKNKNENALAVGSRVEVSVSGNWGGE